jgi:predicted metalloprotease with PDZ domain
VRRAAAIVCLLAIAGSTGCKRRTAEREREVVVEPPAPVAPRTAGDAIEYTLTFPAPETHYVEVAMVAPTGGAGELELMMATWTPGSYLIREYARHVEELRAQTLAGEPLAVDKVRKNRWRVTTGGAERIALRYRLYARELSVRTNFVDAELALLNGAPTFITPVGARTRPHDVLLELPDAWSDAVTALPAHPDGTANRFAAPDYDTLVDSPIVCGNPAIYQTRIEEIPHLLANFGEGGVWDGKRSADDAEKLAREVVEFWGVLPYQRYTFLNVLSGGGGGLEHKASTLMMVPRWMTRKRVDYLRWLGLVSHEFFHTWNGKRLRPVELGPFDYENEVHTRSLWVVEGITSYYDDLLLRRAGLMSHKEYLDRLSANISELQTTPGRKVQPLALSSYDAWIKYYRGDENSINSSISYYTKGAVIGFLLDAEIRRRTLGKQSLDHVMRLAYQRYSGDTGYTPAQFRAVAEEITGGSLADFWAAYIDGTDELDYTTALDYYGLRFRGDDPEESADEPDEEEDPAGWLGASVKKREGRLMVTRIVRDTPAFHAGLNVDDELIAIDGYRVIDLASHLTRYRPGDEVELTVARRGALRTLKATLDETPEKIWKIEIATDSLGATERREAWLGRDD